MRKEFEFNNSSPLRTVTARVDIHNADATLAASYTYSDALKSIKITRLGEEGKFFGFGISQKATIELIDTNRLINITKEQFIRIYFNDNENTPNFYPTEIKRDENSGNLTITAEDLLGTPASEMFVSDLGYSNRSYPIWGMLRQAATTLGLTGATYEPDSTLFELSYPDGANFDGTETIRELFNAAAEITQTIYYIDKDNALHFKPLGFNSEPDLTVSRELYFELSRGDTQTLGGIVSVTELGDNVGSIPNPNGVTQYVRDNPFWELREDLPELVDAAASRVVGATITPFTCSWRGDYRTEPGDKLAFEDKEGNIFSSYLVNDTIEYSGGLKQTTSFSFGEERQESSNPTTLGEVLKQTYAKVDKANKEIELLASESSALSAEMATLRIDTESINAAIQKVEQNVEVELDGVNGSIAQLTERVDASITAQDVTIAIKTELDNGVNKVTTSTGYTLDSEGLKVSKSGTDFNTTITENGMAVKDGDTAVLTANNVGVDAANLHATTYLIIGTNSRIEDYGTNRTGCFWIGG